MKNKLIIIGLSIFSASCSNTTNKGRSEVSLKEADTSSILKIDSNYETKLTSNKVDSISYSFVLSCGSGCALTYDLRNKRQLNKQELELKFHITMYVDEKIDEEHFELYKIKHNNFKVIEIYDIYEKEIFHEEDNPNLFFEIKKLSETVIGSD